MTKTQIFENMRLHAPGMEYLDGYLTRFTGIFGGLHIAAFEANLPDFSLWKFDTFDQFIEDYEGSLAATYFRANPAYEVDITNTIHPQGGDTIVTVRAPETETQTVEKIFSIIQGCLCVYPAKLPPRGNPPTVPPPTPPSKPKKTARLKTRRRDRKRPCRTTRFATLRGAK